MVRFFVDLDVLAGFLGLPHSLVAFGSVFEWSCEDSVALLLHNKE